MEQDGFDKGDNIATSIVTCTHARHVDQLGKRKTQIGLQQPNLAMTDRGSLTIFPFSLSLVSYEILI